MEQSQKKADSGETKVDEKSKILFAVLAILIVGAVAVTFWRYIVKRDYIIQAQIDCDPETQNCFVWECDPMSLEEGEQCTGNPDNDVWYYKIISRNAKNIPDCDPNDENCTAYVCGEGEKDCGYELCAPENVPEGEECNDPEQYLIDNPPEEEIQCEEGDEECVSKLEKGAEEQCAPDDEECAAEESEPAETEEQGIPSEDTSNETNSDSQNIPLSGVEPG
ncbi:MAG: hypothetical protein QMD77_01520 [Patescibacteria group bacterium]|nr:hypothetical protein [Patescibacteria group bacterium]